MRYKPYNFVCDDCGLEERLEKHDEWPGEICRVCEVDVCNNCKEHHWCNVPIAIRQLTCRGCLKLMPHFKISDQQICPTCEENI